MKHIFDEHHEAWEEVPGVVFDYACLPEERDDEPDRLAAVGCSAKFSGSVESFLGVSNNLLKSLAVANYASPLGIDFYRKDRSSMTKMLGPLPNGEWIACTWKELRHSKHLPSEYLQDSKRISRELTFYANQQYNAGRQFAMLTVPALEGLSPVAEFQTAHKKAFKKSEQLRKLISKNESVKGFVVFDRLEGEYQVKKRAIFWHFHMIIELEDGEDQLKKLQLLLNDNSEAIANIWAGVSLKPIDKASFESTAFYCAKPCELAVKLAEEDHKEEFLDLVDNSKDRRMIGRWNGFKKLCGRLSKNRLRVEVSRNEKGEEELSLVSKAQRLGKRSIEKEHKSDPLSDILASETITDGDQFLGADEWHDNFSGQNSEDEGTERLEGSEIDVKEPSLTPLEPDYCGTFGPTPGPGDKLYASIRVRNFSEEAMNQKAGKRWWWNIRESQKELIEKWVANTGEAYNLERVLRPFAHALRALLDKNRSSVHRPTITASARIHQLLDEICKVRMVVKKLRKPHFKLPFWDPVTKYVYAKVNSLLAGGYVPTKDRLWVMMRKYFAYFWSG